VLASKGSAAKAAASKAASAKESAEREPLAEALAGLLRLSGQSAVLDRDANSTHGVSLKSLFEGIGNLDVGDRAKILAAEMPSVVVADADSGEDAVWKAAPAAKRTKTSSLVQPLHSHGAVWASTNSSTSDDKTRTMAKPALRVPPLTSTQKLAFATAAERAKKRAEGMTVMVGARRLLKMRLKVLTGTAKTSADSFL